MGQRHTNKDKLVKGLKYLGFALPLTFLGPSAIYSAFGNQDKPLFIPVLIVGLLLAFGAAFLMFKGIQTLMRALFDD